MAENGKVFIRKEFDFPIPEEIKSDITTLEKAFLNNSPLLDFIVDDLKLLVRLSIGGESGLTEEQGKEITDYYCNGKYTGNV